MAAFTDDEYAIAKSVDLVELAEKMGYRTKRKGSIYSLTDMDSVTIFNKRTWYRYSESVGGSQIDFLMYFSDMAFNEAVNFLLAHEGYHKEMGMTGEWKEKLVTRKSLETKGETEQKEFILPEKSNTYKCLYAYLIKERKIGKPVVDYFVRKKLIYESAVHHNIVFLGRDPEGVVRFASQRGTKDFMGKPYKGDVAGNDKNYGVSVINPESAELHVFEAAIDMMSYIDHSGDYVSNKLALGMVSDGPLKRLLEDYAHIKSITFCLDNDRAGRLAMFKLMRKYAMQGYEVNYEFPLFGKDHNEYVTLMTNLLQTKKQLNSRGNAFFAKKLTPMGR